MGINRVGLSNHINGNPSVAVLEKNCSSPRSTNSRTF
ncbi:hypothetical protein NXV47_13215 [Bacteroides uniformis]|nr:hypothetical protein [Bacteroides uniformis]MCS3085852.1 hypothetical protein [Bacteroides thetaiotaomicron]MCS3269041.1 hypothetical protein [Bacteroides thetaiotaomicron]